MSTITAPELNAPPVLDADTYRYDSLVAERSIPESIKKRLTRSRSHTPSDRQVDRPIRGRVARDVFRVLIVEDDEIDRELISEVISGIEAGVDFQLTYARDGDEALDALFAAGETKTQPDLILLDLNMPGTDGWEVIEEADQQWMLSIPIIVCTSSRSSEDAEYAVKRGVHAFVSKPAGLCDFEELVQAIRDVIV